MNYYKTRPTEFGKTWAILNEKNEVVLCDWRQAGKWRKTKGVRRSKIKYNRIGLQEIETRFVGESQALDGPHLFWRVHLNIHTDNRKHPVQRWFDQKEGNSFSIKQGSHFFATLKEALAFHEDVRKQCSQQLALSRTKPEKAQTLLVELSHWCAQKWGRQARAAREVGATAQTVNDWLGGRKKMTGEQALRVQEFLQKEKRGNR